jgi:ankyrin repeat protein
MGHGASHKVESNVSTIRQLQEQPLSNFYTACRDGDGDVNTIKNLLSSMSIEQINRQESNGSIALHAASCYGHAEIVRILLDAGAC